MPTTLQAQQERISTAVTDIDGNMLLNVWTELDYRWDVCQVTKGSHIEHVVCTRNLLFNIYFDFLFEEEISIFNFCNSGVDPVVLVVSLGLGGHRLNTRFNRRCAVCVDLQQFNSIDTGRSETSLQAKDDSRPKHLRVTVKFSLPFVNCDCALGFFVRGLDQMGLGKRDGS
ncbi:hypothetical protein AVEN_124624-1 [Araneus ventricosus]|uniref:Uncharacterized protein n=1 Tax=Araneus ventricosus TaxID=182803 RepID=A0A4Y2UKL4_ARAVE|nr:hypothetical protein AVEN_124624-1 [Araneus ventricosus]